MKAYKSEVNIINSRFEDSDMKVGYGRYRYYLNKDYLNSRMSKQMD